MKKLFTKQDLINWGISVELGEDGQPIVKRAWRYKNSKHVTVYRDVTVTNITAKHKYGNDKTYPAIMFSLNSKTMTLVLSRVVYTWFKENIKEGYDVDHKDNNTFNNNPDNLQLLTRKENIAKRGIARNQHTANMTDEEILAQRKAKQERKDLIKEARFDVERNKEIVELCSKHVKEIRVFHELAIKAYKLKKKDLRDFKAGLIDATYALAVAKDNLERSKRYLKKCIKGE